MTENNAAPDNDAAPAQARIRADGRTAFILGNGPSLRGANLPLLSPYATIGFNAAYRYWREIDWRPRHYACLDLVVGLSHKDAITELINEGRITSFLLRANLIDALGRTGAAPHVMNYDALASRYDLFSDPTVTTGSGGALWAAHMGFETIVLLGVDGQYQEIVKGAEKRDGIELEIVSKQTNPNYFFDGYQQPGDRYNIPNPRPGLHVGAWRSAGAKLMRAEVSVYNGNDTSEVRFFPFVDVQALLNDGAVPAPADAPLPAAPPDAENRKASRLRGFLHANKSLIGAASLVAVAVLALAIGLGRPGLLGAAAASMIIGSVYALFLGVLYVRYTTASHLRRLQHGADLMKAQIDDLERRLTPH